jgi:RecB family exonuclease
MEYLSYSRIEVFRQCPRLFYERYIVKSLPENETWTFFGEYGSLLHALTECYHNSRGFISKNALIDQYHNGAESRDGIVKGFNDIEFRFGRDSYYNAGLDYIERLIRSDSSKTIGVEQEFLIEIAPNVPKVKGYIDLVQRTDRGIEITDFKTSKKYTQKYCDESWQMSIYGIAAKDQLYGEYPVAYHYRFIRVNDHVVTYRSPEQLEQTKRDIVDIWNQICTSDWQPRYDKFYCKAFCDHNASCPLFKQMQEIEQQSKKG